MVKLTMCTN